ncbi:MAG: hypothetical protein RIQ81_2052 [Pseudomonadota bacterium]
MQDDKGKTEKLIEPTATTLTYDRYLKVDDLLSLQVLQSDPPEHDETLFIIIHQVYELWFKQILHELDKAERALKANSLTDFLRVLKRIHAIQKILTEQVSVLETMTPTEFNRFRERLNPASGFQSHQFRIVEFRLGLKDAAYLKFFRSAPAHEAELREAMARPSIYHLFLQYVNRSGLPVPQDALGRDPAQAWEPHEGVKQLLLQVYREPDRHLDLYNALEALMDLDEAFMLWRYRHVAMVERMIGSRRGTGGSSGVDYLSKTLSKRFFPELWQLRSDLGPSGWG